MKIVNELTVENIIIVLNKQKYTKEQLLYTNTNVLNRFRITDYNYVISDLLNYFFTDYLIENIEYSDELLGTTILINDNIKYKWLEDFSLIEFKSLYPNIISKLWKQNEIRFNIYEFGMIYSFMVDNYENIKNSSSITEVSVLLLRYIINGTFSFTVPNGHNSSIIFMNGHKKTTTYTNDILTYVFEKNPHNVFYIDCDCIYLDYPSNEVLSKINELNLPYIIENDINGMFIEKKKYIIQKNNTVKPKGLSKTFKSKYGAEKLRLKKLQKISLLIKQ